MNRLGRNPFVYGGPVDVPHFVGRQREVDFVFEQVTRSVRGSVAITGERRIGKTSLLHFVSAPDVIRMWNLDQQASIFLFVDCGSVAPLSITGFWQYILTRLRRELERRQRHGALVATIGALLERREIRTVDIEFLLEDIRAEDLILVLLLDEFEWVVRTDAEFEGITHELLGGLRALINHASRVLSLIVATRRPLHEVCRDVRFMGSPFYNNFVYLHLRSFSPQEATSLLDQMLKETGVSFSSGDRDLIFELAGTHPLLLQAAAACLFDARKEAGDGAAIDRRLVLTRFMDLTEHQWEELWRGSTGGEQEVLVRMARDIQEGIALLEQSPNERRRLLERGLIVADGGTCRLFSPMLRDWLMERVAAQKRPTSGLSTAQLTERSLVFVSYSHKDEAEKEALVTQLRVLQKGTELIEVWSDDHVGGGEIWEATIEKALLRARVAILLISANFLSSDFIVGTEVPDLLRRREEEGIAVIPVIAKACPWKKIDWLRRMNVRPKNGRAIWGGLLARPDEDLAAIAEEVAMIVMGR